MKWAFRSDFVTRRFLGLRIGLKIAVVFTGNEEKSMPLINLVFVLIVVGVGLWLINRYIPMASSIKTILNVVVVVAVCVWVLQATGLWSPIASFRLTQ